MALSGSLWPSLALSGALSGSLWLPLAASGSLWLSIALQICLQSPCSAHMVLTRLGTSFLSSSTVISPGQWDVAMCRMDGLDISNKDGLDISNKERIKLKDNY